MMITVKVSVYLKKKLLNEFSLVAIPCLREIRLFEDANEVFNCETNISVKVTMDGYLCSLFHNVLCGSLAFRYCFSKHLYELCESEKPFLSHSCIINVFVQLVPPEQEILDHLGNEMFEVLCVERRELDNAMAWLSTLGGAFSALGDTIEKCADIAGKISVRQMEIACRLGDPFLVARCRLYMALSLIQRNKFKLAKEIINAQYAVATKGPIKDNKLRSMCLGIWAKLKYDYKQIKEQSKCKRKLQKLPIKL